uniref:NADH dehydrogenase subunit 2 n=1 Tax=Bothridium pithonis TaxID=1648426 RepID=A0A8F7GLZ7_9CEST|nr:NADH dehydrogenase subunit 2 [Bothridium pithonis]
MLSRLHMDLFFFSFFFSVLFCLFCGLVDSLLGFWFFLELCGLSVVPSFFYVSGAGVRNFYGALLTYLVMSGLSSVFFVAGILFIGLYYFVVVGFVVKLGLFPFMFWVYRVFIGSNWFFIFLLSVVLKFPILFFCFIFQLGSGCVSVVFMDCFFTIVTCGLMFWFYSHSWECVWGSISLSSVATLMVSCFCSDMILCTFIYFYYFFWAGGVILYFYYLGSESLGVKGSFWLYCFLLLVTPLSFPLFYKLGVCVAIVYSSLYVLLGWCLYSLSEQFFLYKLAGDTCFSELYNFWC